ncbi:hypothetical protein FOS14_10100 [Skermania sp. ID1734]|uniref:hypothetical protein n=1 Tax=Skermania sp. ID1734 TaxID=2597516 RepID=UPI0011814A38|nr:hypothetical protein [Skermania sp. ID1734]TSE00147.1 hypothetical protein FOS14_10100 [Skermania sp. ID1734]
MSARALCAASCLLIKRVREAPRIIVVEHPVREHLAANGGDHRRRQRSGCRGRSIEDSQLRLTNMQIHIDLGAIRITQHRGTRHGLSESEHIEHDHNGTPGICTEPRGTGAFKRPSVLLFRITP